MFQRVYCRSESCRFYDRDAAATEDERTRDKIADWFAARAREDGRR